MRAWESEGVGKQESGRVWERERESGRESVGARACGRARAWESEIEVEFYMDCQYTSRE